MGRKKRAAGGGEDAGYLVQQPAMLGGMPQPGAIAPPLPVNSAAFHAVLQPTPHYAPPDAKYARFSEPSTSTSTTAGGASKSESYSVKKYRPEKAYRSIEAFAKYTKIHRMLDATYVRFSHGGTAEKPYVFATHIAGTNLSWGRGKTRDAAIDAAVRAAFYLVQAHGYTDFPMDDDCLTQEPTPQTTMTPQLLPPPPPNLLYPPPPPPHGMLGLHASTVPPHPSFGFPPPMGMPPPPLGMPPPPPPPQMMMPNTEAPGQQAVASIPQPKGLSDTVPLPTRLQQNALPISTNVLSNEGGVTISATAPKMNVLLGSSSAASSSRWGQTSMQTPAIPAASTIVQSTATTMGIAEATGSKTKAFQPITTKSGSLLVYDPTPDNPAEASDEESGKEESMEEKRAKLSRYQRTLFF